MAYNIMDSLSSSLGSRPGKGYCIVSVFGQDTLLSLLSCSASVHLGPGCLKAG